MDILTAMNNIEFNSNFSDLLNHNTSNGIKDFVVFDDISYIEGLIEAIYQHPNTSLILINSEICTPDQLISTISTLKSIIHDIKFIIFFSKEDITLRKHLGTLGIERVYIADQISIQDLVHEIKNDYEIYNAKLIQEIEELKQKLNSFLNSTPEITQNKNNYNNKFIIFLETFYNNLLSFFIKNFNFLINFSIRKTLNNPNIFSNVKFSLKEPFVILKKFLFRKNNKFEPLKTNNLINIYSSDSIKDKTNMNLIENISDNKIIPAINKQKTNIINFEKIKNNIVLNSQNNIKKTQKNTSLSKKNHLSENNENYTHINNSKYIHEIYQDENYCPKIIIELNIKK